MWPMGHRLWVTCVMGQDGDGLLGPWVNNVDPLYTRILSTIQVNEVLDRRPRLKLRERVLLK